MVEGGRGPAFPVVFFDGEREMNIGDVKINPTLEYKPFQHMLSQRIGISPNQISIYLVDRNRNPKTPYAEDRRRIPITGKVNFGLICRQKDCCFLVVLKRSRKSRYRRERMMIHGGDYAAESEFSFSVSPPRMPPENMVLLRRNQAATATYGRITQPELASLNDRLQSLSLNPIDFVRNPIDLVSNRGDFRPITPTATMTMMMKNGDRKVNCEECENEAKFGKTASFHSCANDAVTVQFTSRFGPINRPVKFFRY